MTDINLGGAPEYLSKDILDEDFVAIHKMFHRFQYILGSCRVEAKDQFVTASTRYQKAYSIVCFILTLISNIIMVDLHHKRSHDSVLFVLGVFSIWYGFATCVSVIVNARFFNGQDNADFYVQMQKVDRVMGLDKVKEVNLILKRINSYSVITLLLVFFVIIIVVCADFEVLYGSCMGVIYAQLTVMMELIYCSNLIVYFFIRVRFINCIVKNHLTPDKIKNKKRKRTVYSNRNIKMIAVETHDFETSDTQVYLKELFDLFTMFQNLYRFQFFIFCLKLVLGSLFAFGVVLFSIQRNTGEVMENIALVIFNVIDVFIAVFIGLRLQLFFGEVKETKRVSIAVMAEYTTGQLREKARKMLKMADETPPRLSIYDMYDMDAGIFLSIFSLITSLIVTLLQFAFL